MWSIRARFVLSWGGISALIWTITLGLQALIGKASDLTIYGFGAAILFCGISLIQQNSFQLFRSICPSTRDAWREYILLVLSYTFANLLIYLIFSPSQFATAEAKQVQSVLEIGVKNPLLLVWITIWILLASPWNTKMPAAAIVTSARIAFKRLGFIILLYAYMILVGLAIYYSPLLGCLCATLPLSLALYWAPSLQQTLQPDLRKRVTLLISIGLMLVGFVSYGIAVGTKDYSFVGELHVKKGWKFEDLQNVRKVEEWSQWYEFKDRKLSAEETIQSFNVLQNICEEQPSDDVGFLVCAGDLDHYSSIKVDWSAADIVTLLKSDNPLSQRLGILSARSLKSPSGEVNALLSGFQDKASVLALAAKNTLSENKNHLYKSFRIHIKKKTEK